ncbi:ECF RNA polymerase sigma factor SigK [Burkholderiales bacterium]|nr:ECF RNA polymerase sigma factor SigK [Burkholderiales bacterium]
MDADRSRHDAHLAELIARVALSDQQAFAELYRVTSPRLYSVALRIVRERGVAEELLQDAYVSVWHHAARYAADRGQPSTWLTAIVRNRCLDHVRRRELDTVSMTRDDGQDAPELALPDGAPGPAEMLLAGADAHAIRDCVERLEGGSRQAIALAFFQGLSHGELARHLAQPLGTVKSWIRRGLERLKGCLERANVTR